MSLIRNDVLVATATSFTFQELYRSVARVHYEHSSVVSHEEAMAELLGVGR